MTAQILNMYIGKYCLALIFGFQSKHLPCHKVLISKSSPVVLSLYSPHPDSKKLLSQLHYYDL